MPKTPWTPEEVAELVRIYPEIGKLATAERLGKTEGQVRSKAHALGLKQNRQSAFFKDWMGRAIAKAKARTGVNRPEQSAVMKRLHAEGKMEFSPERLEKMRIATTERWKNQPHPRGMAGKKHSQETKDAISSEHKLRWSSMTQSQKDAWTMKMLKAKSYLASKQSRGSWKSAWREVGGQRCYFRSSWEANYARFLEYLKNKGEVVSWEHEPTTFWFEGVKRGCVSYLPDFLVHFPDGTSEYHEVKGWMDANSKTKLKRMKKYHPSVKVVVIDGKSYGRIEKLFCREIDGWEERKRGK